MGNLLKFPDKFKKQINEDTGLVFELQGLDTEAVMDKVFEVNLEFFGMLNYDTVDLIEFFTDNRYPGAILVDIDIPDIRGLYRVDLDQFYLIKIMDNTLIHFK
jgi:hypothetical protein